MNKFNKKGFTLIEMLVVIAIIAVLVSIVIPVVGDATGKAEAATDAANLRSIKASMTIAALTDTPVALAEATTATAVPADFKAPASKSGDGDMMYTYTKNGEVTVFFGNADNTIAHYAAIAGGSNS